MKVPISSIGSRGEVQPILALALQLRTLGHGAARPSLDSESVPALVISGFIPTPPESKPWKVHELTRQSSGELRVTLRYGLSVCALIAAGACSPSESLGQADPYWLRSWDKAQESRPATMTSSGRIAPEDEPGTPLIVRGQVVEPDGTPAEGIVVHAYHRDLNGFDFGPEDSALTTWRLQGWAKTDAEGRFEFQTIRPAADHLGREGAHVHFTLESRDFGRQWAPTVFFSDDPLVTDNQRRRSAEAGEFGWVREVETVDGVQQLAVKIRLKEKAEF